MVSAGGQAARVMHGPSLIGIFLNVGLYGVMLAQTHTYFITFNRDRLWIKIYVGVLLLADTLNTSFNIAWIYNTLVNQFGNLAALKRGDWLFESEETMAGIIAMMVQLFYARRILILTKNWWLFALVVVSSCVSGIAALGTTIGVALRPELVTLRSLDVIGFPWLVSCAVCDLTIAATLSMYLNMYRTGLKKSDSVLNKIIRSTVQNGVLTASFTIAHIVAFLVSNTGVHMNFNYGVVKLYTNSIMSSLNARQEWSDSLAGGMSFVEFKVSGPEHPPRQVTINVETHGMVEIPPLPRAKREEGLMRSRSSLDMRYTP